MKVNAVFAFTKNFIKTPNILESKKALTEIGLKFFFFGGGTLLLG